MDDTESVANSSLVTTRRLRWRLLLCTAVCCGRRCTYRIARLLLHDLPDDFLLRFIRPFGICCHRCCCGLLIISHAVSEQTRLLQGLPGHRTSDSDVDTRNAASRLIDGILSRLCKHRRYVRTARPDCSDGEQPFCLSRLFGRKERCPVTLTANLLLRSQRVVCRKDICNNQRC